MSNQYIPPARKKGKRLPKKLEHIVINFIRECEIMNFGETSTLDYIQNMTSYRISSQKYYALRKQMALDDSSWLFNYSRGGFIHEFRERMFVFRNLLEKLEVQYQLELSSRPHENQDSERLKWLGEQIMKANVYLAQFSMSTPVIVAMKMAADPQKKFPELEGIVDEKERERLLLDFGRKFGTYMGRETAEPNPRTTPNNNNSTARTIKIDKESDESKSNFNISEVGEKLGEAQGIRYSELLRRGDQTNDSNGVSDSEGKTRADREAEFRKQKDDFIF